MGIYSDHDQEYGHFRKEHPEDIHEDYEKTIRDVVLNLTPDQRVEYWQSIIDELEAELEDLLVEMHPGATIETMLMLEIFKQLVPGGFKK